MIFTRQEIEDSALVMVVQDDGQYRWSSTKTPTQVVNQLRNIADDLEVGIGEVDEAEATRVNGRPRVEL